MVFSSLPLYLDPHNWQQTQNHHQQGGGGGGGGENPQQPQVLPQPPGGLQVGGAVGTPGSIRPGSMADRARLAKLPQPEPGLKCPRCESTNTKFCYFNNYNLSQPRHFCKTCRRYWTRGGALRNVPVGGGCRRNKRSKSNSSGTSKSPINTNANSNTTSTTTTTTTPSNCSSEMMMSGHFAQQPPQLSLMAASSLQNLTSHYGGGGGGAADIGLNFGGIQPHMEQSELGFQLGSNYSSGTGGIGSDNHHQWRISSQHFPFLGGNSSFEPSAGVTTTTNFYPFQNEGNVEAGRGGSGPSLKMEDSNQLGLNLTKPILGNISENNQYWGGTGNMWPTDFSGGLNSSSTSHLL